MDGATTEEQRSCYHCTKAIRRNDRTAVKLFNLPEDREAWVHGRCFDPWNAGPDVPVPDRQVDAVVYHVGDVLTDGRTVRGVDEQGRITALSPRPKPAEVETKAEEAHEVDPGEDQVLPEGDRRRARHLHQHRGQARPAHADRVGESEPREGRQAHEEAQGWGPKGKPQKRQPAAKKR